MRPAQNRWPGVQPSVAQTHLHRHLPLRRKLERIAQQVLQICCNRFGSVVNTRGSVDRIHAERQALASAM